MKNKDYKLNWEALKLWATLTLNQTEWVDSKTEESEFYKKVAETILEKMKEVENC